MLELYVENSRVELLFLKIVFITFQRIEYHKLGLQFACLLSF